MKQKTIQMIRKILVAFGLLLSLSSFSQELDCQIFASDTLVCYNSFDTLYTEFSSSLTYYWEPGGETTPSIVVQVKDTTTYYLTVKNLSGTDSCTSSITLYTYPRMYVTFEQVNKGCPDECKSQVIATASGGFPPYHYLWSADVAPNDSTLALGLCSEDEYSIFVRDTICIYDTSYLVDAYHLPEIELQASPDTIYRTNPVAEFSFENKSADSIELTNWVWIFPDSTTTNDAIASHAFVDTASVVKFVYTTGDGCIDTVETSVTLKEFEMEIPNVFTPNGDGANETWEVPDLDKYINNQVIIFDRWGKKVFEAVNYNNDWDGGRLGDGVYFYIMKCEGYWKEDIYRGSVTIIGSKY